MSILREILDLFLGPKSSDQSPQAVYENLDTVSSIGVGPVHLHGSFTNIVETEKDGSLITRARFSDNTGSIEVIWASHDVEMYIRHEGIYEVRGEHKVINGIDCLVEPNFRKLIKGCTPFNKNSKYRDAQGFRYNDLPNFINPWTAEIDGKGLSVNSSWRALKNTIIERDHHQCVDCGSDVNLTVDHIIEGSLGGSNEPDNLQTLCKDCHEDKHGRKFLEVGFDADDNYGENFKVSNKLLALAHAKTEQLSISIDYVDREGKKTQRSIYPKNLYRGTKKYNNNKIYCDAYCSLDKARRTFRLSRIEII